MEEIKYYLVYDPSDNEPIFVTTNLELAEKECEVAGVDYTQIPFYC